MTVRILYAAGYDMYAPNQSVYLSFVESRTVLPTMLHLLHRQQQE
jgi:hypothetical protein